MANNQSFFEPMKYLLWLNVLIRIHKDKDKLNGTLLGPDGLVITSEPRDINLTKEYDYLWKRIVKNEPNNK